MFLQIGEGFPNDVRGLVHDQGGVQGHVRPQPLRQVIHLSIFKSIYGHDQGLVQG